MWFAACKSSLNVRSYGGHPAFFDRLQYRRSADWASSKGISVHSDYLPYESGSKGRLDGVFSATGLARMTSVWRSEKGPNNIVVSLPE